MATPKVGCLLTLAVSGRTGPPGPLWVVCPADALFVFRLLFTIGMDAEPAAGGGQFRHAAWLVVPLHCRSLRCNSRAAARNPPQPISAAATAKRASVDVAAAASAIIRAGCFCYHTGWVPRKTKCRVSAFQEVLQVGLRGTIDVARNSLERMLQPACMLERWRM